MSDKQGSFVWYELRTTDKNRSISFYGHVIGWETESFDEQYSLWKAGEPVGGLMPQGGPPHWMGFVGANDVEVLKRKAEALGGKTLAAPTDIPTIGRFSTIADPDGAAVSLFKGNGEPMPDAPEETCRFMWRELMTNDVERAVRFYADLLGWRKTDAIEEFPVLARYQARCEARPAFAKALEGQMSAFAA